MPVGQLYVFFEKMSIQILSLLFNQVVCFFDIDVYELLMYFGY